jgi:hypothetical protein
MPEKVGNPFQICDRVTMCADVVGVAEAASPDEEVVSL